MRSIFQSAVLFHAALFLPRIAAAQIRNPLNPEYNTLPTFLERVLEIIIEVSLPIIVLAIMYAGFLFVTAGGNVSKLQTAKQVILWTLIGALIILGAWAIQTAIRGTVDDIVDP